MPPPLALVAATLLTATLARAATPTPGSASTGVPAAATAPAAAVPTATVPTGAVPTVPEPAAAVPAAPTLPPASDVADARALRWMRAMQAGRVNRSELAPAMDAALPAGILRLVSAEYGPLGAPTGFTLMRHEPVPGGEAAIYRATFASEDATFAFAVDRAGRIIGLHFFPPDPAPGAPQFGPTPAP